MGLSFLIAVVAPLYGTHAQAVDHVAPAYSCREVEAPASVSLPAYGEFCNRFVRSAVENARANGGFWEHLLPSWDAKIDAAVAKAENDAAEAYLALAENEHTPAVP